MRSEKHTRTRRAKRGTRAAPAAAMALYASDVKDKDMENRVPFKTKSAKVSFAAGHGLAWRACAYFSCAASYGWHPVAQFRSCGTARLPSFSLPSFMAAKQWFKQKVGAADRTKEDEDFLEQVAHLERVDRYLRHVFVQAKRAVAKWQSALEQTERMVATVRLQPAEGGDDGGGASAAEALPCFNAAVNDLAAQDDLLSTNILKFNKLHAEMLRDQIERVLVSEAGDAVKAHKDYSHAVLEFDACRAQLRAAESRAHRVDGPPNIAHAKEYLRMAQQTYENKKKGVLNAIKHLDDVLETGVAKTIRDYTANKKRSYLELVRSLDELKPTGPPPRDAKSIVAAAAAAPADRNGAVVDAKDRPERAPARGASAEGQGDFVTVEGDARVPSKGKTEADPLPRYAVQNFCLLRALEMEMLFLFDILFDQRSRATGFGMRLCWDTRSLQLEARSSPHLSFVLLKSLPVRCLT